MNNLLNNLKGIHWLFICFAVIFFIFFTRIFINLIYAFLEELVRKNLKFSFIYFYEKYKLSMQIIGVIFILIFGCLAIAMLIYLI
ncbi:hypothetical protein OKW22_001258 [Bacilli bacterium PM5-3]|nr:hypothetical protein [Bacilli bacterium PM5-3]